jgi:hypothetical protein
MTEIQAFDAVRDQSLRKIIQIAMERIALNVGGEDPATANHAKRFALASAIVNSPGSYVDRFADCCAADDTFLALAFSPAAIATGYPRATIEGRISSVFNTVAGP